MMMMMNDDDVRCTTMCCVKTEGLHEKQRERWPRLDPPTQPLALAHSPS